MFPRATAISTPHSGKPYPRAQGTQKPQAAKGKEQASHSAVHRPHRRYGALPRHHAGQRGGVGMVFYVVQATNDGDLLDLDNIQLKSQSR